MCIEIKEITETEYTINNKCVYKDMQNNWVAAEDLTVNEIKAFQIHLQVIEKFKTNISNNLKNVQDKIKKLSSYAAKIEDSTLYSKEFTHFSKAAVRCEIKKLKKAEQTIIANIKVKAATIQYNIADKI